MFFSELKVIYGNRGGEEEEVNILVELSDEK